MKTKTKKVLDLLRRYEPANMLWIAPDGSWPMVWARARGTNVWDAEGRKYIDLTAAFGVAAAETVEPWYQTTLSFDRHRLAEMSALAVVW